MSDDEFSNGLDRMEQGTEEEETPRLPSLKHIAEVAAARNEDMMYELVTHSATTEGTATAEDYATYFEEIDGFADECKIETTVRVYVAGDTIGVSAASAKAIIASGEPFKVEVRAFPSSDAQTNLKFTNELFYRANNLSFSSKLKLFPNQVEPTGAN